VRFGPRDAEILLVGEGIETVLSVAPLLPGAGAIAALSAAHLGLLVLPSKLATLLIALDNDTTGRSAADRLSERGEADGTAVQGLRPRLIDFNADLRQWGQQALRDRIAPQLATEGSFKGPASATT